MSPQPLNSAPPLGPVEGRGVAEIRALCDAATPEPWSFYLGDLWAGATADELATADRLSAEHVFSDEAEDIFERASHLFHGDPVRPEDAAFIAAARDLVPQLLAEVEAAHRFERSVAVEVAELIESLERVTGERDAFRDERNRAVAERDSLRGVVRQIREVRGCLGAGPMDYEAFVDEIDRALAAAADAPQPEPCGVEWVGCYAADLHYSCAEPKGHKGNHRAGPSTAVLPEKEPRDV